MFCLGRIGNNSTHHWPNHGTSCRVHPSFPRPIRWVPGEVKGSTCSRSLSSAIKFRVRPDGTFWNSKRRRTNRCEGQHSPRLAISGGHTVRGTFLRVAVGGGAEARRNAAQPFPTARDAQHDAARALLCLILPSLVSLRGCQCAPTCRNRIRPEVPTTPPPPKILSGHMRALGDRGCEREKWRQWAGERAGHTHGGRDNLQDPFLRVDPSLW